jgi:hydrogenase/urease accessory protein HupE
MSARSVPSAPTLPTVVVALLAALALAAPAAGHPLAPSLFDVRERESGLLDVVWKTSLLQPSGSDLRPELPSHCAPVVDPTAAREANSFTLRWTVDCGSRGIVGERLRVLGLDRSRTDALVRVDLWDGRRLQTVLSGGDAAFVVPERQRPARVAIDYSHLGVEHILSGLDHLLFVLGLVLLVRSRRALLYTVTAFTLGHSVTLSLAVLGFVSFPPRLVEVAIALSILVLAAELARPSEGHGGVLRRRPWLLAFAFGLLHGLGFAGALAEVGLPPEEIPLSLLSFNVGIELGQLVFIAAVLLARAALRPRAERGPTWLQAVPAYAIGSLAAFWCLERAAALFQ